jgi:hypothetical protein
VNAYERNNNVYDEVNAYERNNNVYKKTKARLQLELVDHIVVGKSESPNSNWKWFTIEAKNVILYVINPKDVDNPKRSMPIVPPRKKGVNK